MRFATLAVLLLALVAFPLTGCGGEDNTAEAACSCEEGKTGGTAWCAECDKGYIEGKETTCKECVEAALAGTTCETCAAKDGDGDGGASGDAMCACEEGKGGGTMWCDACEKGYIKGEPTTCKECVEAELGGPECADCKEGS